MCALTCVCVCEACARVCVYRSPSSVVNIQNIKYIFCTLFFSHNISWIFSILMYIFIQQNIHGVSCEPGAVIATMNKSIKSVSPQECANVVNKTGSNKWLNWCRVEMMLSARRKLDILKWMVLFYVGDFFEWNKWLWFWFAVPQWLMVWISFSCGRRKTLKAGVCSVVSGPKSTWILLWWVTDPQAAGPLSSSAGQCFWQSGVCYCGLWDKLAGPTGALHHLPGSLVLLLSVSPVSHHTLPSCCRIQSPCDQPTNHGHPDLKLIFLCYKKASKG